MLFSVILALLFSAPSLPQVLLLEAYEQLERDVGNEVDKALGRQRDEQQRLQRRVAFLEQALEAEHAHAAVARQTQVRSRGAGRHIGG